ncbi:hypothetical protein [Paenibacillus sp. BC26]|uniref:hypothetical protein n=1 Tax=Paenibacillus sp. BC26 TaxID=1881032 RepID=UPI0015A6598A|nr:hypothetical protein [Paenibacillus sp. BC26]
MISNSIRSMEAMLDYVPQRFQSLGHHEIVQPISEGKWSRLQLLGHLCDSSINN